MSPKYVRCLVLIQHDFIADVRLVQKLKEEIKYEKEVSEKEQDPPEFLAAFLAEKVWRASICKLRANSPNLVRT